MPEASRATLSHDTDPALADADPLDRANPSRASWGNDTYLATQCRRLPTHKFRRLHLNLPGSPDSAAFDGDRVMSAVVLGRKHLPYAKDTIYHPFVDMSGGSNDEAVLGIAHRDEETGRTVLDRLISQVGSTPFNPRHAIRRFAVELAEFNLHRVTGDAYAGQTFRRDFENAGIAYTVSRETKSDLYGAFEPLLNAGEIELLDHPKLVEQLLTLVMGRNGKIDHLVGEHDDHANSACGAIVLAARRDKPLSFFEPFVATRPRDLGPGLPPAIADPGSFENPLETHTDYYAPGAGGDFPTLWWPGKK